MNNFLYWTLSALLILLVIEIIAGRHKGVYRKEDFLIGFGSILIGYSVMTPLSIGIKAALFNAIIPETYRGSLAETPLWIAYPALLLTGEFVFYWGHRWAHNSKQLPWLWKTHRTHHSGRFMNVFLIYRLSLAWFFIIPSSWISALGLYFGMGEAVIAYIATVSAWNLITHSNFRWDDSVRRHPVAGPVFRALEHVFVSPGIHHTHHGFGKDGKAYRNFGTVISLYDWVFGTLHIPEGRPSRYGIPGENAHWLEELFYPLVRIKKKAPSKTDDDMGQAPA